jgi:hypothetical protein
MKRSRTSLIVITALVTAVMTTVVPDVYDGLKSSLSSESLTAEVTVAPYHSIIAKTRQDDPLFREDAAAIAAKLPSSFDRATVRRLQERAAAYDEAIETARANCMYTVWVHNGTRKPLRSIIVTMDLMAAYDAGNGVTRLGSLSDRPVISSLDPGASGQVTLFSRLGCSSPFQEVRVFPEDGEMAEVTIVDQMPSFVRFVVDYWAWVAGFVAFLLVGSAVTEHQLRREVASLKVQLAESSSAQTADPGSSTDKGDPRADDLAVS